MLCKNIATCYSLFMLVVQQGRKPSFMLDPGCSGGSGVAEVWDSEMHGQEFGHLGLGLKRVDGSVTSP